MSLVKVKYVGWEADPLIEAAVKFLNDLGLYGFMPELKAITGNLPSSP